MGARKPRGQSIPIYCIYMRLEDLSTVQNSALPESTVFWVVSWRSLAESSKSEPPRSSAIFELLKQPKDLITGNYQKKKTSNEKSINT